jgi:hypothetical protein
MDQIPEFEFPEILKPPPDPALEAWILRSNAEPDC